MITPVDGVKTYFVRDEHRSWGYFFVNTRGLFVAHTDYGTYGHHWPMQEWDFLQFLTNTKDKHYILGKISRRDYLDEDKTEKAFRAELLRMRREGYVDKERARELYDDLRGPFDINIVHAAMEHREFYERDGYELAVYDYPPSARMFMDNLFPLLQEQLRQEQTAPTEVTAS